MQRSLASGYLVPDLPSTDELLPYLRRLDTARWYSNFGPLVREFEDRLGLLLAARDPHPEHGPIYVATLASGHSALEAGLKLLGIGTGKRVLVPAIAFPACPLAVERMGAEPVLGDVDHKTWRLEPDGAYAAARHVRIDAVMPVAAYGVPVPSEKWEEFSRDTGIAVLIDAAAAFETQVVPRVGMVAHSFHATKPLGIGEGGALASREPMLVDRVRQYSNFGLKERIAREDGTNAKMSEYHAAVGLAQLERWESIKSKRRHLLRAYLAKLAPLESLVQVQPGISAAVASLLMVVLSHPVAEELLVRAGSVGVSAHRTYLPPLYSHPRFHRLPLVNAAGDMLPPQAHGRRKCDHMPCSEWLSARVLGLPFHHLMSESDLAAVLELLASIDDARPLHAQA